jgi:glycosyltransferase involved in cell wall biosynthesis
MRILIATTHCGIVGGVETYLQAVLPALGARGHEVALLYEHPADAAAEAVDARTSGPPAWRVREDDLPAALAPVAAWRPDVVYLQGLEAPAVEEALADRFPTVLFAHNYHGACISGTKRYAFPVARPCGRTFGAACLLHYYPRRCGGLSPRTMVREYRRQRRRQALLARFGAVLVASRHMREEYRRLGVPEGRLHLVPLFPPGQLPDPTPPEARPACGRVLLVGRLTDLKGGRLLIRELRRAGEALGRRLTLVVAGDGPERGALETLARRLDVSAEFLGWVPPARREALMRQADVLAVPSVWPEPFGLVGIEAGCVGLPAVGFAVGGVPDWLVPGESGESAPSDPPTAGGLSAALVRALADPAHLAKLRVGAWRVAQRFTLERHVASLEAVLERAAAESPGRPAGRAVEAI